MKRTHSTQALVRWPAVGLLIFLLTMPLYAQPFPRAKLTHVMPAGAKAGSSLEVTADGANLDGVSTLYFSQPGIKAERIPDPPPKIDPSPMFLSLATSPPSPRRPWAT